MIQLTASTSPGPIIDGATRLPISVIVLAYNEEQSIADCLASLVAWAGEIFVVDSGSTDRTIEIASRYGARIFTHPFVNYARQRNWAQGNLPLNHEWVFHIDADERVTPKLANSMREFVFGGSGANGAMLPRRTVFMGRWIRYGGHYPVYHIRLFRKHMGRCENRLYDQHFLVRPPLARLSGDLINTVALSLDEWTLKHVRWAGLEALELTTAPRQTAQLRGRLGGNPMERRRWLRKSLFGNAPRFFRAFALFFYRYFWRLGFLDGTEGLIFHFLHGCWFRFYVDARIWEAKHIESTSQHGRLTD